ncbi:MAG: 30S ribosome-binding factor RbfA [Candidatus Omnitrophica bacterium]|nr:30S ribosome-binding factor RbfA [Candidatus Omnitrophota bacterium]
MSRMERVNNQVKREIGLILQQELSDPRLMFVSITHAEVSADLRNGRIYFSVLGGGDKVEGAQAGLTSAAGLIRRLLGQRLKMRFTPELLFSFDESIEYGMKIEEKLKEIHNEKRDVDSGN